MNRRAKGEKGESLAINYLEANGYSVLHHSYRVGRAEIDLIAHKEDLLIFVEVKTRKNDTYGYPETFLSDKQKERIYQTAEAYISEKGWAGIIRFDIIAIIWAHNSAPEITHFEDAF